MGALALQFIPSFLHDAVSAVGSFKGILCYAKKRGANWLRQVLLKPGQGHGTGEGIQRMTVHDPGENNDTAHSL